MNALCEMISSISPYVCLYQRLSCNIFIKFIINFFKKSCNTSISFVQIGAVTVTFDIGE